MGRTVLEGLWQPTEKRFPGFRARLEHLIVSWPQQHSLAQLLQQLCRRERCTDSRNGRKLCCSRYLGSTSRTMGGQCRRPGLACVSRRRGATFGRRATRDDDRPDRASCPRRAAAPLDRLRFWRPRSRHSSSRQRRSPTTTARATALHTTVSVSGGIRQRQQCAALLETSSIVLLNRIRR